MLPSRLSFMFFMLVLFAPVVSVHAQYSAFDDPPQMGGGAGGKDAAGAGEIAGNKPEIDGGEIAAGQTAQVVALLHNTTPTPITLERIELAPSANISATIATNQCAQTPIKPGVECAVTMTVKGENSGKYRLGMLIYHSGKSQLSNVVIVGNVNAGKGGAAGELPANEIEAFPTALDFGQTKGRTPLVRSIALRNASSNAITISGIELAASPLTGFSVSAPDCKELQPSQACVATVTWAPLAEGPSQGVLALRHDGPSGSLQIPLKGDYQLTKTTKAELFPSPVPGQGLVVSDHEAVDFGTAVDGAASITVSLVNNGDKDVTFKLVKLAGSDNGLTLSNEGCATGAVLAPNQGCAMTVNFSPRRPGPVIDDIQIIHDGARGVLVLPVRGTATKSAGSSLPMSNAVSSLPKLDKGALDEKMIGSGGTSSSENVTMALDAEMPTDNDPSRLNGYHVTSMSGDRAILAGPRGRILVRDGVRQMIAGGYWKPVITTEGIKLMSDKDAVLLYFDPTMTISSSNDTETTGFPTSTTVKEDTLSAGSSTSTPNNNSSGSGTTTP